MLEQFETVRTTVSLPKELVNRSQILVDAGTVPNRNALIVEALERYLEALEREEIDRQFDAMADDSDYLALNEQIADSFTDSDWEAWEEGQLA